MIASRRWALWLILLPIAGVLAFSGGRERDESDAVVPAAPRAPEAARSERIEQHAKEAPAVRNDRMILALRQRDAPARVEDVFHPHDWAQPPPGSRAAPAPAPTAPPLPYTVLGRKREDGTWQVFLASGDDVHIARQGDVLDDTYRVEEIGPTAMVLTYLPLGMRQTLALGGEP